MRFGPAKTSGLRGIDGLIVIRLIAIRLISSRLIRTRGAGCWSFCSVLSQGLAQGSRIACRCWKPRLLLPTGAGLSSPSAYRLELGSSRVNLKSGLPTPASDPRAIMEAFKPNQPPLDGTEQDGQQPAATSSDQPAADQADGDQADDDQTVDFTQPDVLADPTAPAETPETPPETREPRLLCLYLTPRRRHHSELATPKGFVQSAPPTARKSPQPNNNQGYFPGRHGRPLLIPGLSFKTDRLGAYSRHW